MFNRLDCVVCFSILVVLQSCAAQVAITAEDPATSSKIPSHIEGSALWAMESLERADGKVFRGLLQHRKEDEVKFAEVRRPAGKPWFLVIHYYHPDSVKSIARLKNQDRSQLIERISALLKEKSRARIESGRMDDVSLTSVTRDGRLWFVYSGQWFQLESSADEATTRRCVVRVEQIFRAYQQILPAKTTPSKQLRVVLHGSMDAYRDDLHNRELRIENPAFFSAEQNLIIAGSDLTRYARSVAEIKKKNRALRQLYERKDVEFNDMLGQLARDLAKNGFTKKEITFELTIRNAKWKAENRVDGEYWEMMRQINAVDRRNEALFEDVTQEMFRRLYHEAFHAYVENYVYPAGQSFVPRWLNEGLAQIFENSQLDEGTLRIDAPGQELLDQLQIELKRNRQLTITELLESQESAFLLTHNTESASQVHYLYSWGLAYYLTFQKDLFGSDGQDIYVSRKAQDLLPVVRFEELVRTRLPAFERQWRTYMLGL